MGICEISDALDAHPAYYNTSIPATKAATVTPIKPATPAPRAAPELPGFAVVVGVTAAVPQTLSSTLFSEATKVGWQARGMQRLFVRVSRFSSLGLK